MKLEHVWEEIVAGAFQLSGWFFRGRYQLLARLLGLVPEGNAASPRGTLFLEVDGLGYGHLHTAIRQGHMPFTKRLLERRLYRVHRWRCGLAADTPPIQSGLMYGTSEGVVGFYWWDRRTQRRVVGANPYHMRLVQARLAAIAGHEGLLAGGSSYSNIMSGGARYSVLSIAAANPHWFRPGQGLLRALAILVLNPGKVVRFVIDALWELFQEMEDRVLVTARDRPRILEGAFPLVRLLLNVLAREIVTAGTRLDMLRGVPVIYSCFIGYDVVAHHSGPLSRNSLRVLRGIDGAIRKLFETRAWAERQYDVVLLSDHGMMPCQAVPDAFNHTFETWVEQLWRRGAQPLPNDQSERIGTRRSVSRRLRRDKRRGGNWLSRISGSVAQRSSGWLRTWGRIGAWTLELGSAGAIKLGERFLAEEDSSAAPRVTVISCGPLSQLWVRNVDRRLALSEVEDVCPGFTRALIEHPAIDLVVGREVGREGEEIVVHGRTGTLRLRAPAPRSAAGNGDAAAATPSSGTCDAHGGKPGEASQCPERIPAEFVAHVDGQNPLGGYEEPEVAQRQIAAYASMEACGDIICFASTFTPTTLRVATPGAAGETHMYSFEHQLGTHASIGGDQSYPFLMLPADVKFDSEPIITASQLHPFLRAFVRGQKGPFPGTAGGSSSGGLGVEVRPPRQ